MTMTTTLTPHGSLTAVMDGFEALAHTYHEDLRVYRWQPYQPQLPCVFHWLGGDTHEIFDLATWVDTMEIFVRVGVRHTEPEQHLRLIELYADAVRDKLDDALHARVPLGGAARKAERTSMRMLGLELAEPTLVVEFPVQVTLRRRIVAND